MQPSDFLYWLQGILDIPYLEKLSEKDHYYNEFHKIRVKLYSTIQEYEKDF
jgi:hypothetical protein